MALMTAQSIHYKKISHRSAWIKKTKIMKKVIVFVVLAIAFIPVSAKASAPGTPATSISTGTEPVEVKAMLDRLEVINGMDKSALRPAERKALRKEVRSIKKELASNGGGVYLSVGALLLVIILLIILL